MFIMPWRYNQDYMFRSQMFIMPWRYYFDLESEICAQITTRRNTAKSLPAKLPRHFG